MPVAVTARSSGRSQPAALTPTITPTATRTPLPTATPTATLGPAVQTRAGGNPPSVPAGNYVTVEGDISQYYNGVQTPLPNVPMSVTAHFQDGNHTCTATTAIYSSNATVAKGYCSLLVGQKPTGTTGAVPVKVTFQYNGHTYEADTAVSNWRLCLMLDGF